MNGQREPGRRFGCLHVFLFVLAAVVVTALVSFFVFRAILFPAAFKPTQLSEREEKALQAKLERLDFDAPPPAARKPAEQPARPKGGALEPEAYSEAGADRTIRLTERELNALLAKNTDLADKLAIDLSQDLVSAKLLVPLDEDFPVLGGKTLRVRTGLALSYADGRPVMILRGVSVMGVPLPNAWLGGMKNIDLAAETGGDEGFWEVFADGVQDVRVEDGCIAITLKE